MFKTAIASGCVILVVGILAGAYYLLRGTDAWKNTFTIGGIYSSCKPNKFPAVCFTNKSVGGFSCVPYDGEC